MSADDQLEADLARLIAGELDPSSAEGKAALESAKMTQLDLEALQSVAQQLDHAGAEREAIASAAHEWSDAPGQERVSSIIDELAGPGRASGWMWLWPAAALLMILPLFLFGDDERPSDVPADLLMGQGLGSVHMVLDDGSRFGALEIELRQEDPRLSLELRVFDAADANREWRRYYALQGTRWSNPKEQLTWPKRVIIQVWGQRAGQENLLIGELSPSP